MDGRPASLRCSPNEAHRARVCARIRPRVVHICARVKPSTDVCEEASAPPAGANRPSRNPVILVHGLKDDSRKMRRMARHLSAAGWETHPVSVLPSWGQLGIDELAAQLADHVERLIGPGRRFDLVGFSMGGLVCRYYLQRLGGLARVQRFVSIAAPHRGSLLAWLIPNRGCRQMRPGSEFLHDLASDVDRLKAIQFTSLWTPFDLTIVPATSSLLSAAVCRRMWVVAHPLMVWQGDCIRAVEQALSAKT